MTTTKILPCVLACAVFCTNTRASWYWPFGDDSEPEVAESEAESEAEREPPRLSELMEPASLLIDEASDLASEGKTETAIEKYRAALKELDLVEQGNPDRAALPEFATLRTKRAYVSAAIDSLLLSQVRDNAKPVGVSDTAELERKLADERDEKKAKKEPVRPVTAAPTVKKDASTTQTAKPAAKKRTSKKAVSRRAPKPPRPLSAKEQVMKAIAEKNFAEADRIIAGLLSEKPNEASALNLRAAKETAEGRFRDAERTLDQAIQSNPRNYYAYYNMAALILQTNPENKSGARRYYETGRTLGGPVDPELEATVK